MSVRGSAMVVGVVGALVALFGAPAARADDAARSGAELVKEGNKLLAEFRYADALAAYDKAAAQLPDSAAVAYNRGLALYRLGEYDQAEPAFQDALKTAPTELEAKAKYNLGRCAHESALAKKDKLDAAINDLGRAIRFYQDALQLDPNDQDARKNKELAERLRAFLEKKLEQQKKEQPTSQPSSQPSSQPTSQPDQQESTSQPSSQPTSQPQQGEQGEDQKGDQQEEQKGRQQGAKQDKSSKGKKGDQDKQKGAEKKEGEQEQSSEEGEEHRMKKEEAEPMLQEARDAERQRREAQRERMIRIRGQVPVKKDW
jgi:Ca-activated chloride channel homolog